MERRHRTDGRMFANHQVLPSAVRPLAARAGKGPHLRCPGSRSRPCSRGRAQLPELAGGGVESIGMMIHPGLALVFDMDGVIIDSNPTHRAAWAAYNRRFGIET